MKFLVRCRAWHSCAFFGPAQAERMVALLSKGAASSDEPSRDRKQAALLPAMQGARGFNEARINRLSSEMFARWRHMMVIRSMWCFSLLRALRVSVMQNPSVPNTGSEKNAERSQ